AGFATTVFATLISAFSVAFSQTSGQRPVLNSRSSAIKLEQTPNDDQKPLFKGVVKDINGAVILNAEIVLVNSATKQKRTAFSANEGTFVFEDIVQGMYELNIKAQGFKTLHRPFLFLGQGEDTTAEIALAVGEPEGLILTGFVASSLPQYDNGEPIRLVPATRKHD
ncbi:MAG TPA: carboxypeptidase-like regulatory domain-containing protein, partial [Pyrinomonadaceae bacterium]